jgi:hypothetical protein
VTHLTPLIELKEILPSHSCGEAATYCQRAPTGGATATAHVMTCTMTTGDDSDLDVDFAVCCLDTISGMAEAVGARFEGVLRAPSPGVHCTLREVVIQSCQVAL